MDTKDTEKKSGASTAGKKPRSTAKKTASKSRTAKAQKATKKTVDEVKTNAGTAFSGIVDAGSNAIDNIRDAGEKAADAMKDNLQDIGEAADKTVETVRTVGKRGKESAEKIWKKVSELSQETKSALIPEVYVQIGWAEYDVDDLVKKCRKDYKEKNPKESIRSWKIYIKPEDQKVYYVINDVQGEIAL